MRREGLRALAVGFFVSLGLWYVLFKLCKVIA